MTRTGIKIDLDVGDLLSNAGRARGAISALDEAMRKAEKEKRYDVYGKLAYEKERLQGRANVFDLDVRKFANNPKFTGIGANGQPVFKVDQEYASLIKAQIEAMKRLTAAYEATIAKGDIDSAMAISPQIAKQQKDFHKLVEDATGTSAQGKGTAGTVRAINMNLLANSLKEGLSLWVNSLDRTRIINAYGSANVMEGALAEKQRKADLLSGGIQTGGSLLGSFAWLAKSALPYGEVVGAIINIFSGILSQIPQIGVKEAANSTAYAKLWDERKDQAMNLAALMGSPDKVRGAFDLAAEAAEKFGYSAEEGMTAFKEAIQQGLNGSTIQEIFKYERSTGADRGALSSLANMSTRYGNGDALGAAWVGLRATGMKTGQFTENLRAFERVISDGIQKGFIKSSEEVVKNFMMFAEMTKNNPLWQGEQGAKRLLEMNAGLEQATGLQSASDIMAYRAMRNIMPSTKDYVDVMAAMEQGVTPDFFRKYMSMTSDAEGGNRAAIIERMRQTFGLNYTNARTLFEGHRDNKFGSMSTEEFQKMMTDLKSLPNSDSAELRAAIDTQGTVKWWVTLGQRYWDRQLPLIRDELIKAIETYNKETGSNVAVPERLSTPTMLSRAEQIEKELAPLPLAKGMAIQANRIIENREANDLQRDIMLARTSSDLNAMFFGGKTARGSRASVYDAFFFNKNESDDQSAYNRLISYRDSADPRAQKTFLQAVEIMQSFPDAEKIKANQTNAINAAIPNVMTDTTGQQLLQAMRDLATSLNITINVPN